MHRQQQRRAAAACLPTHHAAHVAGQAHEQRQDEGHPRGDAAHHISVCLRAWRREQGSVGASMHRTGVMDSKAPYKHSRAQAPWQVPQPPQRSGPTHAEARRVVEGAESASGLRGVDVHPVLEADVHRVQARAHEERGHQRHRHLRRTWRQRQAGEGTAQVMPAGAARGCCFNTCGGVPLLLDAPPTAPSPPRASDPLL